MSQLVKWQRPQHLKFPKIYSKFVTTDNDDSSKLVEYRVEDIPESRYHEACEFMVKHFVPYEPKLVARNGKDDPLVLEDYYNKYMNGIVQKTSVACFKARSDEFVAVNILEVLGRNDPTNYGKVKLMTELHIISFIIVIIGEIEDMCGHKRGSRLYCRACRFIQSPQR